MKKKSVLILAILILVLLAAYFGYGLLSEKYTPERSGFSQAPAVSAEAAHASAVPEKAEADIPETPDGPESSAEPKAPEETEASEETEAPAEPDTQETPAEPAEEAEKFPAPDFTVLDMDGNFTSLSDHFGKPLIINFWATWCGPCKSELPAFNAAHAAYGDEITFLMVDLADGERETVENVKAFVAENGYGFPVYFDTEHDAAYTYGITSIPLTLFLDAEGNILGYQIGSMSESVLQACIDELLTY